MRVLILDDDPKRHAVFASHFAGHDVTHTTKFSDFCTAMQGPQFDLVHLDHDLADFCKDNIDHDGMYGSREWTGLDAAWFITCEVPPERQPIRAVIHSWNPAGALRMRQMLQERSSIPVTYEPFQPPPQDPADVTD